MYIKCVYIYVYLVFRKERLGERPMQRASRDALCVISTQRASRDALGTFFKKSIFFVFFWERTTFFVEKSDFFRFFSVKSHVNPTFSAKIAEKPRISANFRDFRDFSGKKSVPAIERASRGSVSHVKSVSPRKERLGTLPEFSRINYFPQETTRRSLGRSLRKTR